MRYPGWRRTGAAVTVVVCAATLLVGGADAHPGLPSSVFDRSEVAWASLRDYTAASFDTELAERRAAGYLAIDIESDFVGPSRRLGAVLQSNVDSRASRVEMRMAAAQYATIRAEAADAGLRQVDFETHTENGTRYFAAAWVQDRENLDARHQFDMTSAQAQDFYEELRGTHMPVDVDAYPTSTGLRFASIWVRNTESLAWTLRRSLSSAEFTEQTRVLGGGYRLLGFDSTYTGSSQNYSGIWVENRNGRKTIFERDLTEREYENRWYRLRDEGYRLVGYERYELSPARVTRYAGIWRQNSDRPTWSLRSQVYDEIERELIDHDVPGMSVAITQNGRVLYQRGHGYADVGNDVWMDSTHVLRLASVSKAVAGVLTMRLIDQGVIAPGDRADLHEPALPAQHTQTIQQLVSNRGCVGHYPDISDNIDDRLRTTRYATAQAAAAEFWNEPLVCTVGQYHYSTHGYTILGAALEAATGRPAAALVRERLTTPFGLGTLRPEDRTTGTVRRSTLYRDDNSTAGPDQISWKVLGGGMESSVADLARFGDLLVRGQILTQARQNQMWTGTGWGYSYGWHVDRVGGHLRVGKDGSQLGANSYLLAYPDDDVVITVLTNRAGGGHDAERLATTLGTIVTGLS